MNIYAARRPHDDVVIVGTRAELDSLAKAIQRAAAEGGERLDTTASDGRGYAVVVLEADAAGASLPNHYAHTEARRNGTVFAWTLGPGLRQAYLQLTSRKPQTISA